jgi:HSP20 family molecular chaperone IbpA
VFRYASWAAQPGIGGAQVGVLVLQIQDASDACQVDAASGKRGDALQAGHVVGAVALKFDPFFRDVDRLAQQLWGAALGGGGRSSMAPMDAWRDGDTIVIELDLPGITPDSLDVNVEHDALTVRAERVEPADSREWLVSERPHGAFTRQLSWAPAWMSTRSPPTTPTACYG